MDESKTVPKRGEGTNMKLEEMLAILEREEGAKHEDEFLKFNKVKNKRSKRPDLHAFLLLEELCPAKADTVAYACHEKIYLEICPNKLAKKITEEQVVELLRCGVLYDDESESLFMFT
jgi:hypothetical protein